LRKVLLGVLFILMLLFFFPVPASAQDLPEDLLPAVDSASALSPVENLRFSTVYTAKGERRLRIAWEPVEGADQYYLLYSFEVGGGLYPNSKLLDADRLYFEPAVLGCGVHTFRVYPLIKNMTCEEAAEIEVFVANSAFFPSMLSVGEKIDYHSSADIERGLERFDSIASELKLSEKDEFEQVFAIHQVLCKRIAYNTEESDPYRAILTGKGLCDAYARGFKILCDLAGISCEYIVGRASDGAADNESHAWNMVRLGAEYYNVDVTWDAIGGNFQYFLVPDQRLTQTHTAQTEPRPHAVSSRYLLIRGRFGENYLRMTPGESRTVSLILEPMAAAFRAKLSVTEQGVAAYRVEKNMVSVHALRPGLTTIQMADGDNRLDSLLVEVVGEKSGETGEEEEKRKTGWPWYLFWGMVFLFCGAWVWIDKIYKRRKTAIRFLSSGGFFELFYF